MGKKIIIGNLKTNMDYETVVKYIERIKNRITYPAVILVPTSLYVPYFKELNIKLAVQNIHMYA